MACKPAAACRSSRHGTASSSNAEPATPRASLRFVMRLAPRPDRRKLQREQHAQAAARAPVREGVIREWSETEGSPARCQARRVDKRDPETRRSGLAAAARSGPGMMALIAPMGVTIWRRRKSSRLPEASQASRCPRAVLPGSSVQSRKVLTGWHRGRPDQGRWPAVARNRMRRERGHKAKRQQVWSS